MSSREWEANSETWEERQASLKEEYDDYKARLNGAWEYGPYKLECWHCGHVFMLRLHEHDIVTMIVR
jgi:hypothetical protein